MDISNFKKYITFDELYEMWRDECKYTWIDGHGAVQNRKMAFGMFCAIICFKQGLTVYD